MSTPSRRNGCPVCGKPATAAATPFCSQGCRDRDLLRWLGDGYRVPGRAIEDDEAESASDGLDRNRRPPL
ncbi:DNA gyrase inhibitor YacG [Sphingomonas solaris]|uniref:DNA gyrase inhibitor YacG n=1 Tax=Alterirhizorhabdus solaris TaxID=2529389 RepID=A0A558R1S8_9SPHN|nr:DNA gyrase inhibitor YacG [Sphingomonas solaris]TVV73327.1 DNA gyrase inhibitor YacG [Sphingomonas solaris]